MQLPEYPYILYLELVAHVGDEPHFDYRRSDPHLRLNAARVADRRPVHHYVFIVKRHVVHQGHAVHCLFSGGARVLHLHVPAP